MIEGKTPLPHEYEDLIGTINILGKYNDVYKDITGFKDIMQQLEKKFKTLPTKNISKDYDLFSVVNKNITDQEIAEEYHAITGKTWRIIYLI